MSEEVGGQEGQFLIENRGRGVGFCRRSGGEKARACLWGGGGPNFFFFRGRNSQEGQKGTPGRGRDRKCHDRASLSHPLVLPLGPLTSLTSFPLFCTSEDINGRGGGGALTKWVGGEGDRIVMTFSDVFLPVPFLASLFDTDNGAV